MYINQSVTDQTAKEADSNLSTFKSAHKAELQTLTEIISKITSRTSAEIEPYLEAMIEGLVEPPQQPLQKSFDSEKWEADMKTLAEGADKIPILPSEAFTRASIYQDHD
jgi:hypothetical protein